MLHVTSDCGLSLVPIGPLATQTSLTPPLLKDALTRRPTTCGALGAALTRTTRVASDPRRPSSGRSLTTRPRPCGTPRASLSCQIPVPMATRHRPGFSRGRSLGCTRSPHTQDRRHRIVRESVGSRHDRFGGRRPRLRQAPRGLWDGPRWLDPFETDWSPRVYR